MPYVAGESVADRLTREKQLPLDDALSIAREVADALSYAHGHGVIHRDITPDNILLQAGSTVSSEDPRRCSPPIERSVHGPDAEYIYMPHLLAMLGPELRADVRVQTARSGCGWKGADR